MNIKLKKEAWCPLLILDEDWTSWQCRYDYDYVNSPLRGELPCKQGWKKCSKFIAFFDWIDAIPDHT
jgi:hypothetical protein